jgi:hypothetical protein
VSRWNRQRNARTRKRAAREWARRRWPRPTRAQVVANLRNSARIFREFDLDGAHRYELRADAIEQGAPLPTLHGYWRCPQAFGVKPTSEGD